MIDVYDSEYILYGFGWDNEIASIRWTNILEYYALWFEYERELDIPRHISFEQELV